MHISFRSIREHCLQFTEKQGFPLIVTVCVAVITASALWTGQQEAPYVSPTPPVNRDVSAAQLLQQSLPDAVTPTPEPSENPATWVPPLKEVQVLRSFDMESMFHSGITGTWQFHTGVDLSARQGTPVYAMSHGSITAHGKDDLQGVWYEIDHDGIIALYAGMITAGDFLTGDEVEAGDTLGFVGRGLLEESDLGTHLHLEATDNGVLFDPLTLWTAP